MIERLREHNSRNFYVSYLEKESTSNPQMKDGGRSEQIATELKQILRQAQWKAYSDIVVEAIHSGIEVWTPDDKDPVVMELAQFLEDEGFHPEVRCTHSDEDWINISIGRLD